MNAMSSEENHHQVCSVLVLFLFCSCTCSPGPGPGPGPGVYALNEIEQSIFYAKVLDTHSILVHSSPRPLRHGCPKQPPPPSSPEI